MRASGTCNFPRPDCFASCWPRHYAGAKTRPEDSTSLFRGLVLPVFSSGYSPSCVPTIRSFSNPIAFKKGPSHFTPIGAFCIARRIPPPTHELATPPSGHVGGASPTRREREDPPRQTYVPSGVVLAWRATGPRGVPWPDGPTRSPGGDGRENRGHRAVGNSLPSPVLAE